MLETKEGKGDNMKETTKVAVIGGGASGLAAAVTAAELGAQVVVLERMDRIGKKLLATGNGRCNLGNLHAAPEHFSTRNRRRLEQMMAPMAPQGVLDFFSGLGLLCQAQPDGKLYPYCNQASMVLDVLRNRLEQLGVEVLCGFEVRELSPVGKGWRVTAAGGRRVTADRVILAAGGQASPKLGSDGSGLALAKKLGHHLNPVYPSLVPIRAKSSFLPGLKGLRAQGTLSLYGDGKLLGQDTGEIQFADYGVSGIPAMQLSARLGLAGKGAKLSLSVDFLPQLDQKELEGLLFARREQFAGQTLEQYLLGTVSKKIAYAVLKSCGLAPLSRPVSSLSAQEVKELAAALKDWRLPVEGTLSWDQAQVMGGGVRLDEVAADTMESVFHPGLYLTGELLDAAGECGGFNLHWAWWTGILAARAAVV